MYTPPELEQKESSGALNILQYFSSKACTDILIEFQKTTFRTVLRDLIWVDVEKARG